MASASYVVILMKKEQSPSRIEVTSPIFGKSVMRASILCVDRAKLDPTSANQGIRVPRYYDHGPRQSQVLLFTCFISI